jgi:DNA-binding SARP family transcriptional activator
VSPSSDLRIALFSGPRIELGGRDITPDLPGRQGRTLLAYLAARWPEAASRDTLFAVIWPEGAPADPPADFRAVLAKLRRGLWPDGIQGRELLALHLPEGAQLDTRAVAAKLADAVRALEGGDASAAYALAEAAQATLARPFLPGLQGDWVEEYRRGFEEQHRRALEVMARAGLALGGSHLAHAERAASALVAHDRFREDGYALLMEVQAARGNLATALRTFDELRVLLREELGARPAANVLALHERLLRGHVRPPVRAVANTVPRGEAAAELPPALERELAQGPFVGREAPLLRLRARWALAAAGERQFVVLTGEPGIGKTRLVSELARGLHADGATVLYGRSDSDSIVPYQPLIGALGPYVKARAGALRDRFEPELRELARFLPALQRQVRPDALPGDDPQAQRYRLHEALARVIAAAGRERPAALLLDDLHWADTATVLALSYVLEHPEPAHLLVAAMAREHECTEVLGGLLARWQHSAGFELVTLGGLDERETAELSGRAGDAALLHERTGGNPLFVRELVSGGLDLGRLPPGIKATIGRRVARLGEPAGRALALAAVEGYEFSFEVLEAVLGDDPDELIRAVETAVDAGLVHEIADVPGRFVFSHALVREALYEQQSALRRPRAHARVGATLARAGARPAEVARHFYIARAPQTSHFSVLAARDAAAALAYEEAAEHYRRALETHGESDEVAEIDLLLALAAAESAAGQPEARRTYARAADLARHTGDPVSLTQAALGRSQVNLNIGALDAEAVSLLEEALAVYGEHEDALAVELRARLASALHFHDFERARSLTAEAVALARRVGDLEALLNTLESVAAVSFEMEELNESLAVAAELLTLAREAEDRELEGRTQVRRIHDLLTVGDIAAARAAHREVERLSEELRLPRLRWEAARFAVVWAELEDRLAEAWALADRALVLGRRAQGAMAAADFAVTRCVLLHRERALGKDLAAVRASAEQARHLVAFRAAVCLGAAQAGELAAARAELESLAADDFAALPRDAAWRTAVALLAEASALLQAREHAAKLYEQLLPHRHYFVQAARAACMGSAEYYLGVLAETMGDTELAIVHYELAAARNAGAGLRYRAAQAIAGLARTR